MVRDDDFDDVGYLCMDNFTYNENVMSYASYEPDDYIVDDEDAWYNFLYDGDGG
jgi:hypothetical protein